MGTFYIVYRIISFVSTITEQVTRQALDWPVSVLMLSGLSISSALPLVGQERDTIKRDIRTLHVHLYIEVASCRVN